MSMLKISVLPFPPDFKKIVLYCPPQKYLLHLVNHVREYIPKPEQFRMFWIDEDGDKVQIKYDPDFQCLLKSGSHKTPTIYFEYKNAEEDKKEKPQQTTTSSAQRRNEADLCEHTSIDCDECKMFPIRRHRYKSLHQCLNFDLCMKCEDAIRHSNHILLCIPNNETNWVRFCPIAELDGSDHRQMKDAAKAAARHQGQQSAEKSRQHCPHCSHCINAEGILEDVTKGNSGSKPESFAA